MASKPAGRKAALCTCREKLRPTSTMHGDLSLPTAQILLVCRLHDVPDGGRNLWALEDLLPSDQGSGCCGLQRDGELKVRLGDVIDHNGPTRLEGRKRGLVGVVGAIGAVHGETPKTSWRQFEDLERVAKATMCSSVTDLVIYTAQSM